MIETIKIQEDKFRLSCSLYELVEIWSMRKSDVELTYLDADKIEQRITGVITNIYSRDGLEQLVVENEIVIPTKNIILVNDVPFRDYLK